MNGPRIQVVCRKRPMNLRESQCREYDVIACTSNAVHIREPKQKVDMTHFTEESVYKFDNSFDETVSNKELYNACVKPLLSEFFDQQAICTCFCYGQTGSGKTYVFIHCPHILFSRYTMLGGFAASSQPSSQPSQSSIGGVYNSPRTSSTRSHVFGVFPLAMHDLFDMLDSSCQKVIISCYEIYCAKLYDLLNNRNEIHAMENGQGKVVLQNIYEMSVDSLSDLIDRVSTALSYRTVGVTSANADSSRSHAIIQVRVVNIQGQKPSVRGGQFTFVDLAGSERAADTIEQDRQRRVDGAEINRSLLALKECIRAMDQGHDFVPFRGSRLTQVLKHCFVGKNCVTLMIANIAPNSGSVEQTVNTVRYAYRVKELGGVNSEKRQILDKRMASSVEVPAFGYKKRSVEEYKSRVRKPPGLVSRYSFGSTKKPSHKVNPSPTVAVVDPSTTQSTPILPPFTVLDDESADSPANTEIDEYREILLSGRSPWVAFDNHQQVQAHPTWSAGDLVVDEEKDNLPPSPEYVKSKEVTSSLEQIIKQHDELIGHILQQEEELILAHRKSVAVLHELGDSELCENEKVRQPGSCVDSYVEFLENAIATKEYTLRDLRGRVAKFKKSLAEEESLNKVVSDLMAKEVMIVR